MPPGSVPDLPRTEHPSRRPPAPAEAAAGQPSAHQGVIVIERRRRAGPAVPSCSHRGRYEPARARALRDARRRTNSPVVREKSTGRSPARRGRCGQVGHLSHATDWRHPIAASQFLEQPGQSPGRRPDARVGSRGRPPRARSSGEEGRRRSRPARPRPRCSPRAGRVSPARPLRVRSDPRPDLTNRASGLRWQSALIDVGAVKFGPAIGAGLF